MAKIEFIHPKTKVVREVEEDYEVKVEALKRAGFVLKSTYRAPKERVVEPEPTLAEKVEDHGEKAKVSETEKVAEKAIHGEALPSEADEGPGEDEPDADEPEVEVEVKEEKAEEPAKKSRGKKS